METKEGIGLRNLVVAKKLLSAFLLDMTSLAKIVIRALHIPYHELTGSYESRARAGRFTSFPADETLCTGPGGH